MPELPTPQNQEVQKLKFRRAGWTKSWMSKSWTSEKLEVQEMELESWMSEWLDEQKNKVQKLEGRKAGCPKACRPRAGCLPVFSIMKHLMIIDNDSRKASK